MFYVFKLKLSSYNFKLLRVGCRYFLYFLRKKFRIFLKKKKIKFFSLPLKKKNFVFLKSVHIDKKSRDIVQITHSGVLIEFSVFTSNINLFVELLKNFIPAGLVARLHLVSSSSV